MDIPIRAWHYAAALGTAILLSVLTVVAVSPMPAHAAAAEHHDPPYTLTKFDYGVKAIGDPEGGTYVHSRDLPDFTIKGSYHAVDVVDAVGVMDNGSRYTDIPFTLQLFSASTGNQVGSIKHCTGICTVHWTTLQNGRYFVLHRVPKPKKGATYYLAGTEIYGVS